MSRAIEITRRAEVILDDQGRALGDPVELIRVRRSAKAGEESKDGWVTSVDWHQVDADKRKALSPEESAAVIKAARELVEKSKGTE